MSLPNTNPRQIHRPYTILAALATSLILTGCGTSTHTPHAPGSPTPHPHQSYRWYAASPTASYDHNELFIKAGHNSILGSDRHVLAVGHRICHDLPTTTITPLIISVAAQENIDRLHAARAITDAINLLCDPLQPTHADRAYLNAVTTLDKSLTAHPDLTIYRGHDTCYLLNHHTPRTTATTIQKRAHVDLATAHKLITIARHTLCTR